MIKTTTFAKQKPLQTLLQTLLIEIKKMVKAIFNKKFEPKNNLCKLSFAIANVDCFNVSFQIK